MSDHHDSDDFAHPLPLWMLLGVFAALTFLTVVTVAQSNFNLGSFDIAAVMFIATIKALLVMLIFMHLAFDKPFNIVVFLSSFIFVGLFVTFTLSDAKMTSPDFIEALDDVPAPLTADAE